MLDLSIVEIRKHLHDIHDMAALTDDQKHAIDLALTAIKFIEKLWPHYYEVVNKLPKK